MYSIAFPNMLSSSTRVNLVEDHEATAQNLINTLRAKRGTLFGDPYFGSSLERMLFEQNNLILKDLVIDEIYADIITFVPQVKVSRNDITLTVDKDVVYVTIKATNLIDNQTDLYNIKLTEDNEL